MKRALVLFLVLFAVVPAVHAQETPAPQEAPKELPPPQRPELEARTSDRSGAFDLRAGPYKPVNILRHSANTDIEFEDIYGKGSGVLYGINWEFQPLHHKYIGNLGIGLGGGFYQKRGKALKEDGTKSKQDTELMILPATADITYRMELWENQPVVPFGGAGVDYWYFREGKEGSDRVTGAKKGWHWRAGGEILLDLFDKRSAGNLDANWGINNSYIFGEWRSAKIDNFGKNDGFDFSTDTWFGGLLFEY